MRSSRRKQARLGGLPALHQGRAGRHGGREPQDRAGRAPVHHADARGKGLGQKLLDFARKKLPEHAHPVLTVLDKNTRAIALYRRMGWKVCGVAEVFDPAKDGSVTAHAELLEMRYEGPAEA